MNEKNRLQEFCHKHRLPLPVYTSNVIDNHFWTQVSIGDELVYESRNGYARKKESEMDAAREALGYLPDAMLSNTSSPETKVDTERGAPLFVYLDAESVVLTKEQWSTFVEACIAQGYDPWLFAFCGDHHGLTDTSVPVERVNTSGLRDVVDQRIVIEAAMVLQEYQDALVYILTKDHFAHAFAHVAKTRFPKATVIVSTQLIH